MESRPMRNRTRVTLVTSVLVLLSTVLGAGTASATASVGRTVERPSITTSPLPACRYADVLTKYRTYHDWRRTLLDPIYMVPSSYAPTDLVSTSMAGLNGGHYVRSFVIYELRRMFAAARAAGAPFAVQSAYRSYATQAAVFAREVRIYGYARALKHDRALALRGLGHDQGRRVAEGERLEVRVHHELPEGQVDGDVLRLRALALPVRGTTHGEGGLLQRPHTPAVPLVSRGQRRVANPIRPATAVANAIAPAFCPPSAADEREPLPARAIRRRGRRGSGPAPAPGGPS
jgi:hypothetical protein